MNYFGVAEHFGIAPEPLKKLMKLAGYENYKTRKFTSGELGHMTKLLGSASVSYTVGSTGRDAWHVQEVLYYPSIGALVTGGRRSGYLSYFSAQDAAAELTEIADIKHRPVG